MEKTQPQGDTAAPPELEDNVLIISRARDAVVFPYTAEALEGELSQSGCADINELVQSKYTVPLSRYKHAYIRRFKEAFALVRDREGGSFWSALDLALELFFVRYLHPAVIAACRNLDELDVYLDCLDKNELDEFPFFAVRFEPKPRKPKRK